MNPLSPTLVGFRLLFRRPVIFLAEVAWRWTFAAGVWALAIGFIVEYFASLTVTSLDRLLLYTGQPFLMAQAFRRIFSGSSVRLVEAGIVLGFGLAVAWIVLASVGRMAVLRSIFEQFGWEAKPGAPALRTLAFLNFLRAAALVAAKIAAIGGVLLVSSFWASTHTQMVNAARLGIMIWVLIFLAWAMLNWTLSAAAIFVIKEGADALAAIGEVLRLFRLQTAGMLSASAVFGTIHLVSLGIAVGSILVLLPIVVAYPVALPLLVAVVMGYSLIADYLYTGRLAAYSYLAWGEVHLPWWIEMPRPRPIEPAELSASVDKGELILGDLPSPA